MNSSLTHRIEISAKTIITILLIVAGLFIGSRITDIIVQLMLAFVLMTALNPAVSRLQRLKFTRFLAVLWIYAVLIGLLILSVVLVVPPLVQQTIGLVNRFDIPKLPFLDELKNLQFSVTELSDLWTQYGTSVGGLITFVTSTFSVVFSFFTVLVMTLYLLLERDHLSRYTYFMFQTDGEDRSKKLFDAIERALGNWVRGESLLMLTIGTMTFVGLTLMGVPYALPLAITAGILEALPNIGPTFAAVPAIVVALVTVSPLMGGLVAVLYWAIQALENNFIVPFVMRRAVGINPLTSIVLILMGLRFGGVLGALLVVPYYIVVRVVLREFGPEIKHLFSSKNE